MTLLEHFYQDSVTHQPSNSAFAETVAAALARQPIDRVIRILEVGGGTGGLTAHVLPKLRANRTEFVFSDADESCLTKAEQKFFEYSFVRYQPLDISKNPVEQKFKPGNFDLILVSQLPGEDSVATTSLSHIRQLLAPGGLLLLLGQGEPSRWLEFVFGLSQSGNDRPAWPRLLADSGFEQVEARALTATTSASELFLARGPMPSSEPVSTPAKANVAATRRTWLILADASGVGERLAGLLQNTGMFPCLYFRERIFNSLMRPLSDLRCFGSRCRKSLLRSSECIFLLGRRDPSMESRRHPSVSTGLSRSRPVRATDLS